MLAYEQEHLKLVTDLWNANKIITNPGLRRELGKLLTGSAPRLMAGEMARVEPAAKALARDGFYFFDINKAKAKLDGVNEQLEGFKIFQGVIAGHGKPGDAAQDFTLAERPKDALIVRYHFEDIIRCEPLRSLAVDPEIVSIVEAYIGCTPTIASYQVWWTFCGDQVLGPELFHRDRDDFNFVKLFLYLNDVDDSAGPHEFVQHSHNPVLTEQVLRARGMQNRLNDVFHSNTRDIPTEELRQIFGDKIQSFTGKAGTMFLEDTYGLHRGTRPTTKPRLIFSVSYTGIPLRYATAHDRAQEMNRKLSFADAGMKNPSELEQYMLRFFLN